MIFIELMGGLGNQLFQIFCVISYSFTHKIPFKLKATKLDMVSPLDNVSNRPTYWNNFLSNLNIFTYTQNINLPILREPGFTYNALPYHKQDYRLFGYFQSYKYFEGFESELRKEFQFKREIEETTKDYFDGLKEEHKEKTITGIHVRRGDTVGEDHIHNGQLGGYLVLPNADWYNKMITKLRNDDNIFLVISDDIEWCKENIKGDDVVYSKFSVEGHSEIKAEYLDLCLITHCDNFVMSCSTFSWWGAWLSKKDGDIFVPDRWWGRKYYKKNESDIRLPKWNSVSVTSDYEIWGPDGTRY